jgi:hypothetical protein
MDYKEIFAQSRSDIPKEGAFLAKYQNGNLEYFIDGKRSRNELDGPAVICTNGIQIWMKDDMIHRLNGPAITINNEVFIWYQRNKLHRTSGPAYVSENKVEYWINGEQVSEKQYDKYRQKYLNSEELIFMN